MCPSTKNYEQKEDPLKRVPCSKPPFTLSEIRKAVPPHCFHKSLIRSFASVGRDLIFVVISSYIATTYFHLIPSPLRYLAWATYWIMQGFTFTGLWIICHDCGHNAFSDYRWIDDTVGFILHSALLTPYFSWKLSHRRHHSTTGTLHDEVYPPMMKSSLPWFAKYLNNTLGRALILAISIPLGLHMYLSFNVFGRPYERFACHYDPYSPIYNERERLLVIFSDAGIITSLYVSYKVAMTQGLAWLVSIYGMPLLVMNGIIVVFTMMNHTHSSLPHYDSSEWDRLRGSLSTVDRDCGMFNTSFHDAMNTHVLHHLFMKIPHYNAVEATNAIKPILGEYYKCDGTPIYKAVWRDFRECLYVEKDEGSQVKGVYWYKNQL